LGRKENKKESSVRAKLEKIIQFMRNNIYGSILKEIIRWRWIVITIPVALFFITIGMFQGSIIHSTFFPAIAFDFFAVDVSFTPGAGEKQTMKYLNIFDQKILEVDKQLQEEFSDTNKFITYSFKSIGSAFNGQEQGAHAGNVTVLMRDMEGAPISTFEIARRVRKAIGKIPEALKFTVGGMNRWGKPLSISLLSKNLEELEHAKDFMMQRLQKISELKNLTTNKAEGKQEVRLKLKQQAYFLGLTQNEISNQVRQGFFGGQVQRLQQGKDEIRVWVRYPKQDRVNLGQLEKMKIKTPRGDYPLSELVSYKLERGPVNIQRFNGSREVRIESDLVDPYEPVPPILERIDDEIISEMKANFPGIKIVYQGQQKTGNETVDDMKRYFSIAFAVIILILIIHFKSLPQALIILMMIPLSFLGASWGHWIHGHPVSILSAWGMVALSGVIINDAVVFLSKYNSNVLEGMSVTDAVYDAGISRFRAIMLTTITTVVGLFPIILEKSFQAQFLIPMAISLAYGVLVGTAFILIFFPVIVLVLSDVRVKIKGLFGNKNVTAEELEPVLINNKVSID